ncbi:hypothetical protein O181_061717 [Austropuccinia psidii MF-1]|uniref:DUF4939 domain-containing protein n=1 Tax=Austropuccinia psidii MF-1 TaxID=1389203 RepID=A0A9Q3ER00_9BASI|nr:hypothetical protein [Austropuccinia psidii MF-1]
MPVQHSPPTNNTRSQINTAVLTPTARVPLDHTPSVHELSENLDRGPPMEGAPPSRRGGMKSRISTSFPSLLGEVPQGSNLASTNQPLVSQSDPSLLKIMDQMATIMGHLSQAEAHRDNSKAPAFNTPSMKEPDSFDGTQAHKLRGFIQSCQLIFHNDPASLFSNRKNVRNSTSFLTGRAGKWIEPYLSNISN